MEEAALLETQEDSHAQAVDQADYPLDIRITNEMLMHMEALRSLFVTEAPHIVPIQPTDRGKHRYFIGDASAEGFGSGVQYPDLIFEAGMDCGSRSLPWEVQILVKGEI